MKIGRIIGIVGGILILVGIFLPWLTASGSMVVGGSQTITGFNLFGILVLIFGIVGLILTAIGGRGTSIGGLVMGIIAFVLMLLAFGALSWIAGAYPGATIEVGIGVYISLIGSLILIIGSALAFVEAGKAKAAPPPMVPGAPPPA